MTSNLITLAPQPPGACGVCGAYGAHKHFDGDFGELICDGCFWDVLSAEVLLMMPSPDSPISPAALLLAVLEFEVRGLRPGQRKGAR